MALHYYPINWSRPAAEAERADTGLDPTLGERIVTVVATALAVLVVAAIAVLMGMT
jgi:hypothetical protein